MTLINHVCVEKLHFRVEPQPMIETIQIYFVSSGSGALCHSDQCTIINNGVVNNESMKRDLRKH